MFVRYKKNQSGTTSIQVLEKSSRSNRLVKTFGVSSEEESLRKIEFEAAIWIDEQKGSCIFRV